MIELSPKEAFEKIKSGEAFGIDVREINEWNAGHAVGVDWNPMSSFEVNKLPLDRPLIFICRSGNRSMRVAEAVSNAVPNQVFNMSGGMLAWQEQALPMESNSQNPEVI